MLPARESEMTKRKRRHRSAEEKARLLRRQALSHTRAPQTDDHIEESNGSCQHERIL